MNYEILSLKTAKKLKQQELEIDRLNDILDKIEKALKDHVDIKIKANYGEFYVEVEDILNYIQELRSGE